MHSDLLNQFYRTHSKCELYQSHVPNWLVLRETSVVNFWLFSVRFRRRLLGNENIKFWFLIVYTTELLCSVTRFSYILRAATKPASNSTYT